MCLNKKASLKFWFIEYAQTIKINKKEHTGTCFNRLETLKINKKKGD